MQCLWKKVEKVDAACWNGVESRRQPFAISLKKNLKILKKPPTKTKPVGESTAGCIIYLSVSAILIN